MNGEGDCSKPEDYFYKIWEEGNKKYGIGDNVIRENIDVKSDIEIGSVQQ